MIGETLERPAEAVGDVSRSRGDAELLARFIAGNDPDALAALVGRFGGMVWGVCRRILSSNEDAEDAFQAVFIVLMRRGGGIHNPGGVGGWLYGVAYRTAMKARRDLARRRKNEVGAPPPPPPPGPTAEAACRDLQRVIDEEVGRLPEKFRVPFVLCCVEGLSKPEAARELGWKEGTVSGRLAEARKTLQTRLVRRGVTLAAALTVLELTRGTAAAAAPAALCQATVAGLSGSAGMSSTALGLAEGVMGTMTALKMKLTAALLALAMATAAVATTVLTPRVMPEVKALRVPRRTIVFEGPSKPIFEAKENVTALAYSPDGKSIAVGGAKGAVTILDAGSRAKLADAAGHTGAVTCLGYTPDGGILASGSADKTVRLWNATTGAWKAVLDKHTGPVRALAVSPNSKRLATTGDDAVVHLWDSTDGKHLSAHKGHTGPVNALAFSSDGARLASGGADKSILVWDPEKPGEPVKLQGHTLAVRALAFADDALVSGGDDGTIQLWRPAAGQSAMTPEAKPVALTDRAGAVYALAYLEGLDGFVSGSMHGAVKQWALSGPSRGMLGGDRPNKSVTALAIHPKGEELISAGTDATVRRWLKRVGGGGAIAGSPLPGSGPPSSPLPLLTEFYQDLRENRRPVPPLAAYGIKHGLSVQPDERGLRVRVAANPEQIDRLGVTLPARFRGDFEITAGYAILSAARPKAGEGVGLSMYAELDSPQDEMVEVLRFTRVMEGGLHGWCRKTTHGGKDEYQQERYPTESRAGHLRLTRKGAEMTYSVRERGANAFKVLKRVACGTEDVKLVRFAAFPGFAPNSVDVLLKDLRVAPPGSGPPIVPEPSELDADPTAPDPPQPAAEPVVSPTRGRFHLILGGLLSLLVLVMAIFGVVVVRRRRVAEAPEEEIAAEPRPPVVFACEGCGRRLRTTTIPAGRSVPCPGCGGKVIVPKAVKE